MNVSVKETQGEKGDAKERKKVDRKEMYKKKTDDKDGIQGEHGNFSPMKGKVVTMDKDNGHKDSLDLSSVTMEVYAILGMIRLCHIQVF